MPSRYALLNLHLFQRKVTQSPVRRHKDLHCGRVQGGHILSHFASVCLIFRPLDLFVFEKKPSLWSENIFAGLAAIDQWCAMKSDYYKSNVCSNVKALENDMKICASVNNKARCCFCSQRPLGHCVSKHIQEHKPFTHIHIHNAARITHYCRNLAV